MPYKSLIRLFCLNKKIISSSYINCYSNRYSIAATRQMIFKSIKFSERNAKFIFNNHRFMAGHAKWQNIKVVKSEKDRQKSLICNKYVRLVTAAVREKGPDPKSNNKLAVILEDAKKNNVPSSALEGALKRSQDKKLKPGSTEISGPGGIHMIIDYETDNISTFRHAVKTVCKKYGGNLLSDKTARWKAYFEQKGIIKVTNQQNANSLNSETMLDSAIEAGAEDVQKVENEGEVYYEFLCSPDDLHPVKKELEKKYEIEEAYIGYLPLVSVQLDESDMILVDKFLNELEELPDVVRIFENVE